MSVRVVHTSRCRRQVYARVHRPRKKRPGEDGSKPNGGVRHRQRRKGRACRHHRGSRIGSRLGFFVPSLSLCHYTYSLIAPFIERAPNPGPRAGLPPQGRRGPRRDLCAEGRWAGRLDPRPLRCQGMDSRGVGGPGRNRVRQPRAMQSRW